jgi:hypothetical protein
LTKPFSNGLSCELLDGRLDPSSQKMEAILDIVEQSMQLAAMETESFQDRISENSDDHPADRE